MSDQAAQNEIGIYRYLVRYGLSGRVGRFGSIRPVDCRRGDRVVVHTDRGIEAGEVLVPPAELSAADQHAPAGELLRLLTHEDERVLLALRMREAAIVGRCRRAIEDRGLSVEVVEAESLLDARTTILYFVGPSSEELGRLSVELASDPRERVRFEPLLLPGDSSSDDVSVITEPDDSGVQPMKGPYERLKYDFRRVWECPACKRRERTDGGVTSRQCTCTTKGDARGEGARPIHMKMIEDGPRPRFPARPRWPRLPEEIEAAQARSPAPPTSPAVAIPLQSDAVPPADPPGPPDDLIPPT